MAQPVIKRIPILGEIVEAPFAILEKFRKMKSDFLNIVIARKIEGSNFKTESDIP